MTFTKVTKCTQTEYKNTSVQTQTEMKTYEVSCQTDVTVDTKIDVFKNNLSQDDVPDIVEIKTENDIDIEDVIKTEELLDDKLIFVETNNCGVDPINNQKCRSTAKAYPSRNVKIKCDPLDITPNCTKVRKSKRKRTKTIEDIQENCPLSIIASRKNDYNSCIIPQVSKINFNVYRNCIRKNTVKRRINNKQYSLISELHGKKNLNNYAKSYTESVFEDDTYGLKDAGLQPASAQSCDVGKTNTEVEQINENDTFIKPAKRKRNIDNDSTKPSTKKNEKASKSKCVPKLDVKHSAQYYIDKASKEYNKKHGTLLEEAIKDIQQQWRVHERNFRTHGLTKKKLECEKVTEENEDEIAEKIRLSHGRKYGKELKFLALNLYYSNPIAYTALRLKLNLPVEKTLRRIDVGVSTKLTKMVLKCVKILADRLNEDEKHCVICADLLPVTPKVHKLSGTDSIVGYHEIDEVQSQEPATQILVVMVRSVISEWKQPLICSYLKENFDYSEVISWLDGIIAKITEAGLNIVALTCKPDRHFIIMSIMRNVTSEKPYFFVNNQKVYQIFDAPTILVGLRDLLMDHNIEFDYENQYYTASWKDIEKLYVTDLSRSYKLAPKLNEHCIRPHDLDKLRVDFAAQLFSNTVASALNQCIELKVLSAKSLGTVKLIELINQAFDVLNSSSEKETNKYKQPFANKPHQKEVLDKILNIFSTLKVTDQHNQDITSGVDEISCMKTTIHSISRILSDLQDKGNQVLFTRNLSLEYLHNYILMTRKTWGQKTTTIIFRGAFRKFYLQHIIKKSENNSSCGLDKELISALMYND